MLYSAKETGCILTTKHTLKDALCILLIERLTKIIRRRFKLCPQFKKEEYQIHMDET